MAAAVSRTLIALACLFAPLALASAQEYQAQSADVQQIIETVRKIKASEPPPPSTDRNAPPPPPAREEFKPPTDFIADDASGHPHDYRCITVKDHSLYGYHYTADGKHDVKIVMDTTFRPKLVVVWSPEELYAGGNLDPTDKVPAPFKDWREYFTWNTPKLASAIERLDHLGKIQPPDGYATWSGFCADRNETK